MPTTSPGDRFQGEVRRTLSRNCGVACYSLNKDVPLSSLEKGTSSNQNLEMDLLIIVGKCAVLVETTMQKTNNSDKIRRFIRHCDYVRNSSLALRERFQLLGKLPSEVLDDLESIEDWRYLYIGTSNELIDSDLTPARYPESDSIYILNGENWEYLKQLSRRIGEFSKYELMAAINIGPSQMGDASLGGGSLKKPALETKYRTVAPETGRADLYLMVFRPSELLRVGRVLRYRGQPIAIESPEHGSGYQRILIPDKLTGIAQFIEDSPAVVFPSTLTVVLSPDCNVEDSPGCEGLKTVIVPDKYASIDIIDGQHRLFAYAQNSVSNSLRENNALLVTAIKFRTNKPEAINQYAARTFVRINGTHTRVKRALIDVIAYDVLGDTSKRAIAAKILLACTNRPNKALSRVFKTSELSTNTADNMASIPTVLVVDELTGYFDVERYKKDGKSTQIERTFGCPIDELQDPTKLVAKGIEILEKYFSCVNHVFPQDWRNKNSHLMCAKYIGGFIRLLGHFTREGLTLQEIESRLGIIKSNLASKHHKEKQTQTNTVIFCEKTDTLPSKRDGSPRKIFELLEEAS